MDAPPVVAIIGMGGQLRARLPDGSDVVVGQTLYRPGAQATVKLITQTAVTWEVCERNPAPPAAPAATRGSKPSPAAPDQPRCFRRTSSPTGA